MNEQVTSVLGSKTLCVLIALLAAISSPAEIRVVPTQYPTIRAAVEASSSGDEVVVEDGVYTGPDNRNIEIFEKSLTIRGKNGAGAAIIDCQSESRAFRVVLQPDQAFEFSGLTVRFGRATVGGAVLTEGGAPRFLDCRFEQNRATRDRNTLATGGAILSLGGAPLIADCVFDANAGLIGGGVAISSAVARIERTTFSGHDWLGLTGSSFASTGGALAVVSDFDLGSAEIVDCMFVGNRADTGGAVLFTAVMASIVNTNFDSNMAEPAGAYGGTLFLTSAIVRMRDSTIRNSGIEAVRLDAGTLNAIDCVFEECDAFIDGVGTTASTFVNCRFQRCNNVASVAFGSQMRFQNSIFANVAQTAFFGAANSSITAANCVFARCRIGTGLNASIAFSFGAGIVISNSIFAECEQPLFAITQLPQPLVRSSLAAFPIAGNNLVAIPQFRDPIGPDGTEGTSDDDFSLIVGAAGIDAGNIELALRDVLDIDGDTDVTERTPIDFAGQPRAVDDPSVPDSPLPGTAPRVDIGAFEFQPPCVQPGDVDGDGDVDLTDLCFVLHNFGTPSGMTLRDGDLDLDSDVDLIDLAALLTEFGMNCAQP